MRLIILLPDATESDLLAYAFKQRGHQVQEFSWADGPTQNLPFEPHLFVIGVRDGVREQAQVAQIRQQYPEALILAIADRHAEPIAAALVREGAYEVVRSPYNPNEVVMGCEVLMQRSGSSQSPDIKQVGDLQVELARYFAAKNGVTLTLTKLELRLLHCLCEHYPRLASMERLLSFGWEESFEPDPSLLKTHISHIRRKLESAGGVPMKIVSRQGAGYLLVDTSETLRATA